MQTAGIGEGMGKGRDSKGKEGKEGGGARDGKVDPWLNDFVQYLFGSNIW